MAWSDSERSEIVKALAVVCEVTGATYSQPAKQFLLRELESYGPTEVLEALQGCARRCKGRLTLADVIEQIEDQEEKDRSKRRALASAEETQLRIKALENEIPWEMGKERVRNILSQMGKLSEPGSGMRREPRKLPACVKHWSDTEPKE